MIKKVYLFLLLFVGVLSIHAVSAVESGILVSKAIDFVLKDNMRIGSVFAHKRLDIELKTVATILFFLSLPYDLGLIPSDDDDFPYQSVLLDDIGFLDAKLYGNKKGPIGVHLIMLDCYNIMRKICDKFEELSETKKRIPNGISKLDWNQKAPHLYNLIEIGGEIFDVIRKKQLIDFQQMDDMKKICFERLTQQIDYENISDQYLKCVTTDSSYFQFNIFQRLCQDLELKIQDPDCNFIRLYNWYKKIYATHFMFVGL